MKRFCLLLALSIPLFTVVSNAQDIDPDWIAVFQGPGDNSDRFNKIISDGSGNFIGIGYTIREGNYRDILTVKFNANGDTLWYRTKNGSGNADDEGISGGVDAFGNVYVTGYAEGEQTQNNIMVIKYDAAGTSLWDTTWDSPASMDDYPVDLRIDASGNCIVGGNAEPDTIQGSSDYVVVKFNPSGGTIWSMQYNRPGVTGGKDELKAMTIDDNGNVFVTGRSLGVGPGANDDWITIKYDGAVGTELWVQTYNSGGNDRPSDIVTDHSGNIIVTGQYPNGGNLDIRTIKFNNDGQLQWTKFYSGPAGGDDIASSIAVDASNNVIVAAASDVNSSSAVEFDFRIIKYDSAGTQKWAVPIPGPVPQDDIPNDMVVDAVGNIYVTGKTDSAISPTFVDNNFMTVMLNSNGAIQWGGLPRYYAGTRVTDDDIASSLVFDGGYIYVVGGSVNSATHKDATVVKYEIATGDEVWVKEYNGKGDFTDLARTMIVDGNNYAYAAGYSFQENHNRNAVISKINPSGTIDCTYQYRGEKKDDDEFVCMAIDPSGMIYAAGYTKVVDQKRNMLLVKWNPSTCDTVWTRTYDYIGQSDRAISMVIDWMGNVYLTGRSDANWIDSLDNDDIVTFKYDENGNVLWMQRYDGTGSLRDEPVKIIIDGFGDVLVTGRAENVHDDEFIIIKYNSATGAPVWSSPAIFNSAFSNDDRVNDIAVDAANNIYICGYSQTSSGPNAKQDPVVLKYDQGGNLQGFYSYVADDQDEAVKIVVDDYNRVYVLFKMDNDQQVQNYNNYDYMLQRFDDQLIPDAAFLKMYNSPVDQDDVPADLLIGPTGNIFVTGRSEHDTLGGRINNNWVTLGYDTSGAQIFYSNTEGPNGSDDAPSVFVYRGASLWVAGYTDGLNNNQRDLTVNHYNMTTVGVNEMTLENGASVYPNPFNNYCTIVLNNSGDSKERILVVTDITGRLAVEPVQFFGDRTGFDRSNLSGGVYQFRIISGQSVIATGKLVLY